MERRVWLVNVIVPLMAAPETYPDGSSRRLLFNPEL
jgi:hypothetical protein